MPEFWVELTPSHATFPPWANIISGPLNTMETLKEWWRIQRCMRRETVSKTMQIVMELPTVNVVLTMLFNLTNQINNFTLKEMLLSISEKWNWHKEMKRLGVFCFLTNDFSSNRDFLFEFPVLGEGNPSFTRTSGVNFDFTLSFYPSPIGYQTLDVRHPLTKYVLNMTISPHSRCYWYCYCLN